MRVFEEECDNYLRHFHDPALRGPLSLDKQYLSSHQALAIGTGLQAQKRLQLQRPVIALPLCSLLCLFQLSPPWWCRISRLGSLLLDLLKSLSIPYPILNAPVPLTVSVIAPQIGLVDVCVLRTLSMLIDMLIMLTGLVCLLQSLPFEVILTIDRIRAGCRSTITASVTTQSYLIPLPWSTTMMWIRTRTRGKEEEGRET